MRKAERFRYRSPTVGASLPEKKLDTDLMSSITQQMMTSPKVQVRGKVIPVRRTSAQRLRRLTFTMNRRDYEAIEQNPQKPSRWGQLVRKGHQVVQFKDNETNRFVAVAVDGKVKV